MAVFGVIVSNRSFFPDHLVETGRRELLSVLESMGHQAVILPPDATHLGAVESVPDGIKCAALFNAHPRGADADGPARAGAGAGQ